MRLENFSGQGDNKYLKYYIWYTEFSELVMKKEYSLIMNIPCPTLATPR